MQDRLTFNDYYSFTGVIDNEVDLSKLYAYCITSDVHTFCVKTTQKCSCVMLTVVKYWNFAFFISQFRRRNV